VRPRRTLLICGATLVALLPSGSAAADSGGGAAVPAQPRSAGGGVHVGAPLPAARTKKATKRARRRRGGRRRSASAPPVIPAGDHVFPVAGPYGFGGEDARFGAPRAGHTHQGQDVTAARGTPVVAPYAGVVTWVRYQRGGAGHYVVLRADDEYDYVFMHLRRGSILVAAGQRVVAGEQLGQVGNSGRSFGAHLHFEVWTGGWFEKGGHPVDPLPLLQDWA
jgi:murein DD-endopeptidase MepM/ murein hydrolase activator NlpD